ncbi:MAG: hypothetical protein QNJ18_21000 [Xenococcaceae cyanobacterium MO_167.B52]|nr:hypothetical protein [Xenococcaceae cyanobacterium MO_167.B52]
MIAQEGVELDNCVGKVKNEAEWEYKQKITNLEVEKRYEKATKEMQAVIDTAITDIKEEVESVLKGDFVQAFIAYVEKSLDASVNHLDDGININILREQFSELESIAKVAGINILKNASRSFLNTASKTGFLRSVDVAGSRLYITLVGIGKTIGFKFKPWQAVGIAKNIGNFAKCLSPILAVVAVGRDLVEVSQGKKKEQQMADARRQIISQFKTLAKDLEHQVEIQFSEFDVQVYGKIEQQIIKARKQNEDAIALSDNWMKELILIRQEFEAILKSINPTCSK